MRLKGPDWWKSSATTYKSTLKHSKGYLIIPLDTPLLVQVRANRQNDHEEPRLLVSLSVIRSEPNRCTEKLIELMPFNVFLPIIV